MNFTRHNMRNKKEIVGLFGENFIAVIKRLLKKTSLTRENIKAISDEMGVREVYENENRESKNLISVFESMLDAWYEAFEDYPPTAKEAQDQFLGFLKDSHCVPLVIKKGHYLSNMVLLFNKISLTDAFFGL